MKLKITFKLKCFAFCLAICFPIFMWADVVTPQQAREQALRFMQMRGMLPEVQLKGDKSDTLDSLQLQKYSGVYVVNAPHHGGFVVVSGNDRLPSVLGYSDEGTLNVAQLPQEIKSFLSSYEKAELEASTLHTFSANIAEKAKPAVRPFVQTLWNQDNPYNLNTPKDANGEHYPTGCVATAMAQVIALYQYPKAIQRELKDYQTKIKNTVKGYPNGAKIDWEHILLKYDSQTSTPVEQKAVSDLMSYCGVAVNMEYNNYSGAFLYRAAEELKKTFGYDAQLNYIQRDDYSFARWTEIIYQEVAAHRPVIYGGQSTGGGHAFVCDGFDGKGYYHINWGWGGAFNGYFLLGILQPADNSGKGASSTKDGYSMGQEMIIGIQPSQGEQAGTRPSLIDWKNYDNNTHIANILIENNSFDSIRNEIGAVVYDEDNQVVKVISLYRMFSPLKKKYIRTNDVKLANTSLVTLPNGTYKLLLTSRDLQENNAEWQPTVANGYLIVTIENGKIVGGHIVNQKNSEFSAQNITLTVLEPQVKKVIENASFTYRIKVKNNGPEFYTKFQLIVRKDNQPVNQVKMGLSVPENGENELEFPLTMKEAGNYTLEVVQLYDKYLNGKWGEYYTPIKGGMQLVVEPNNYDVTTACYFNQQQLGDSIIGTITVTNNSSTNNSLMSYRIFLGKITWSTLPHVKTVETELSPNEKKIIRVALPVDEAVEYQCVIDKYVAKNTYQETFRKNIQMSDAIQYWTSAGSKQYLPLVDETKIPNNASAVDLSKIKDLSQITPNENTYTLYYVAANANVSSAFDHKNVIKGGVAERIAFSNHEVCYIPQPFHAQHITYERTFTKGVSKAVKQAWEGLVLPFAPTSVTRTDNGKNLSWFKSDAGKGDFWLKEFVGINAQDRALFDYVTELKPYMPYLIAVPHDGWGEKWDLVGKTLRFAADNVDIVPFAANVYTSTYVYSGTLCHETLPDNTYTLNAQGDAFVHDLNATTSVPFSTVIYYQGQADVAPKMLPIFDGNTVTGIQMPEEKAQSYTVYSLTGAPLGTVRKQNGQYDLSGFAKGVYIINGEKVMK